MDTIEEQQPKKNYSDAQRKATKKYRENNKEKVNEQRKKYYKERIASDPQFVEYKRMKAKEYYHRKKAITTTPEKIEESKEPDELPIETIEAMFSTVIDVVEPLKEEMKLDIKPTKSKKVRIVKEKVLPNVELEQLIKEVETNEVINKEVNISQNIHPIPVRRNRK